MISISYFAATLARYSVHIICHQKKGIIYFHIKLANKLEKSEDNKGVISSRRSKDRQYNGQRKKGQKDKQRFTNITLKIKDRATRTPLKPGVSSNAPEG